MAIEVDDLTSEAKFRDDVARLVAMVTGLDAGTHNCACGRIFKVGLTSEFREVVKRLRAALASTGKSSTPETSRFALLEVDDD